MTEVDNAAVNRWFQRRDPEAFKALLVRYSGMVYSTSRRVLRNAADAEDVTQECFEALVQLKRNPGPYLGCWLHRVATNLSLKRIRADTRRKTREEAFTAARSGSPDAAWNDIYAFVDEAIAELPDRFRVPVVAHYLDSRTQADIASELGLAQSTVAYRISQGVARIGKSLKKRGVIVPGSLAVILGANLARAESVPAPLSTTLGKLALSQSIKAASSGAAGLTLPAFLSLHPYLSTAAAVAALLVGLYFFVMPHPRGAPSRHVEVAEMKKFFTRPAKPPATAQFPQLKTKVVGAMSADGSASESGKSKPLKPASISGRVLDENTGAGIAGASVYLKMTPAKEAAAPSEETRDYSAPTDANGNYRISDITCFGNTLHFASAEGYSVSQSELDALRPGEAQDDLDIKLKPAVGRIAGRVISPSRDPIPEAQVEVITGPESAHQIAITGATGAFSIGLPAMGMLVLRVTKHGYGTERFNDIAVGTENLELTLPGPCAIAGRVTGKEGKPKRGLKVIVSVEPDAQERSEGYSLWSYSVKTSDDGQYRVDDLSASYTYNVKVAAATRGPLPRQPRASAGLAAYVRQQKEDERDAEEFLHNKVPEAGFAQKAAVQVAPGQVTRVDFQIAEADTDSAIVHGRVTDPESGAPVCPLTLQAFWHESVAPSTYLTTTTTGLDGSYVIYLTSAKPGERIWVTAGWDRSAPAGSAQVDPEVPQELNFSVAAPIVVPVRCVDRNGAPMPDLALTFGGQFVTDADGRAVFYGLAPYVTHTISAYSQKRSGRHSLPEVRVGTSAPFAGKPGEQISEVLIPCSGAFGAITGQIVVPPEAEPYWSAIGRDVLHMQLTYEGAERYLRSATMDKRYRFTMDRLEPGTCTFVMWIPTSRTETQSWWWASAENVEIVEGQTTNLGVITLNVSDSWPW